MGLMDYKARMYDPLLGRFPATPVAGTCDGGWKPPRGVIQPDTLIPNPADPQSWNRYSYVENRPIIATDPDGHCYPLCTIAAGAAVGAIVGAGLYAFTNQGEAFNWGEFAVAAGAGAIAGGLIGTGVGMLGAATATGGFLTAGTAVLGGGLGMAGSGAQYMLSSRDRFDSGSFVLEAGVGGSVGAISAVSGPTGKLLANVAGAEALFLAQTAMQGKSPLLQDALEAAGEGLVSGVADAVVSGWWSRLPGTAAGSWRAENAFNTNFGGEFFPGVARQAAKHELAEGAIAGAAATVTTLLVRQTLNKRLERVK